MAVQRGSPPWRAWLTKLLLPYADLGVDGGPGRIVAIPDDMDMVLSYPVLQAGGVARSAQALSNGALLVSPSQVATVNSFATGLLSLAATTIIEHDFGFTANFVHLMNLNQVLRITVIVPGMVTNPAYMIGAGANLTINLPCTGVILNNVNASPTSYGVDAYGA